ncbi:EamA family transporter [bacterium]|nr:EamA family transporter [bacterium]
MAICITVYFSDLYTGGIRISDQSSDWFYLVISGILTLFSFWGLFKSMRELPVSEQILLSRASVITYTLGGFIILGENVTRNSLLGIMLIILGILLSSIRKEKLVFNKWVIIQLLSSISFGLSVMIDKVVSPNFSVGMYTLVNIGITTVFILGWSYYTKSINEIHKVPKEYIKFIAIAGAFSVTAYFLQIKSYELGGLVSLVGALSQVKIIVVVLGGYFIFNEKSNVITKLLGVITVLIGVVLIKT